MQKKNEKRKKGWRFILTMGALGTLWFHPTVIHASGELTELVELAPETLSNNLKILILFTFLTFLPAIVMTMTSFTRTIVVFSMVRTGMGTQTTPPNQVLIGLALFLTFFIMSPVLSDMKTEAIIPYEQGELTDEAFFDALKTPIQTFMLNQTRAKDLELFVSLTDIEIPDHPSDLPLHVVVPAFVLSELKTAFEISFMLFVPFMIIDLVVSSVLMSMGMFMLPPSMISLPFKILLFVMVDGWYLIVKSLVEGFM